MTATVPLEEETLVFDIKINKVDELVNVVQFVKKEGSLLGFHEVAKKVKDLFEVKEGK